MTVDHYRIRADAIVVDVDLDKEPIVLRDGTIVDESAAEAMVRDLWPPTPRP